MSNMMFLLVGCFLLLCLELDSVTAFSGYVHQQRSSSSLHHGPYQQQQQCRLSRSFIRFPLYSTSSSSEVDIDTIRKMRVRELKDELKSLNVRTDDVFEKEELVLRLVDAQMKNISNTNTASNDQKKNTEDTSSTSNTSTANSSSTNNKSMNQNAEIRIPLSFYSLEANKPVEGRSHMGNGNVFLRPSPGKFAAITMKLPNKDQELTMLVDTACSGIVVRPSIISKYGLPLHSNGSVSMTSAGGTASGTGLSSIPSYSITDVDGKEEKFTSLPVAVQDIGALPEQLDGIVGLSFLNQFASVCFDFESGELQLYKHKVKERTVYELEEEKMDLVTESSMKLCRLGVWIADVNLDGRGPTKMLVDTGAASTFLNWDGIKDMNLSRDHPLISFNSNPLGAMGADNQALALTHRFVLQRRFKFQGGADSMFLPGLDISDMGPLNIDIGNLPVLETLKSESINGILGSDLLMRCDLLQLNLSRSSPKISLYQRRKSD